MTREPMKLADNYPLEPRGVDDYPVKVGSMLLTLVDRLWQVYAAFVVMSFGWATMSGAAVNIMIAPWFDQRPPLDQMI